MRRPVARRDSRLQDAAVCSVSAGRAPLVTGNVSRVTCHVPLELDTKVNAKLIRDGRL